MRAIIRLKILDLDTGGLPAKGLNLGFLVSISLEFHGNDLHLQVC